MATAGFYSSKCAIAQPDSVNTATNKSEIHRGTMALQFQLGDAFSLRGNQGFVVSGLYYLSPRTAIRVGIDLNAAITGGTSNSRHYSDLDSAFVNNRYNEDRDGERFNIMANYVKYYPVKSELNFYWGAGPLARFSRDWSDVNFDNTGSGGAIKYTAKYLGWSAGFSGVAGAVWYPTKRIGITADYGASVEYAWYRMESTQTFDNANYNYSRKNDRHSIDFGIDGVAFGITIYF
jgi:hypothetical protein